MSGSLVRWLRRPHKPAAKDSVRSEKKLRWVASRAYHHATQWAATAIAVFGVINIIYAAFVCLAQSDLKQLIAYSSVRHMGFTLLGMAAMTPAGISGAGYALMGLAAAAALGVQRVMIYMLVYLVMNLGAFLAVIVIGQAGTVRRKTRADGLDERGDNSHPSPRFRRREPHRVSAPSAIATPPCCEIVSALGERMRAVAAVRMLDDIARS